MSYKIVGKYIKEINFNIPNAKTFFLLSKDIKFSFFYKKLNILSSIFIIFSIVMLFVKGLNLGVDFKGGTLIELRTENSIVNISEIRQSFIKMNLGDVTVKKFGKENDYLVKIEMTKSEDENFIKSIVFIPHSPQNNKPLL